MTKAEINALETRYKATALMLINLNLMEGKIDKLMEEGHMAFDCAQYVLCGKILDLVNLEIIEKLEL